MSFTDAEIAEHAGLVEELIWSKRRPPVHLRDRMREGQRFTGQAVELFYVRPVFNQPGKHVEESIAKIRYVRTARVWLLFWKRADRKWHGYQPFPEAKSLATALRVVDEDPHNCFFG